MKQISSILLGVWLVLMGLKSLLGLSFQYDHVVLGILAVAAGVMVVLRR